MSGRAKHSPKRWRCALAWLPALLATLVGAADRVEVGAFSRGDLSGWQRKAFKGLTDYRLERLDGIMALRANSAASGSGLYREITVDLVRTPYLNWSWRVERTLGPLDEQTREGDDYPARIYLVASGGLAFWRSRALNYVWSSSSAIGSSWPNAFAGASVMMLAVRQGEREAGHWVRERRNVRDDWRRLFGDDLRQIDAVALMTDTDNSAGRVVAYYGDIFFSSE